MSVYIFDTETTSREPDREVIEAAWIRMAAGSDLAGASDYIPTPLAAADVFCGRYAPTRPMTLGALAVHHILPSELEGAPRSELCKLPGDAEYVVGHSIDFDWEAVGKPNVKRIDTCAIARYVYPDVGEYSQSALLYHVLGQTAATRDRLKNAHSAMQDVENNALLLQHLLHDAPNTMLTWSALYAYSEVCRIPRVMPIGEKQGLKGLPLAECYDRDPGFVSWCLRQDWLDPYLRKGLEAVVEAGL